MPNTTPTYWGAETEYTAPNNPIIHSLAALKSGGWVAVGTNSTDGYLSQEMRIFDALGVQVARVPLLTAFSTSRVIGGVMVEALPDGGFVVIYRDDTVDTNSNVFLQRYNATGAKVGPEVTVENGVRDVTGVTFDVDDQGAILIAYSSHTIESDHGITGQTIRDGYTYSYAITPNNNYYIGTMTIEGLAGGNYALAYASGGQSYTQVYTNNDDNIQPEDFIDYIGVTETVALQNGNFVVLYTDSGADLPDRSGTGTYFRMYGPEGQELGGPIKANTRTSGDQSAQQLVALKDGGFMAFWWDGSEVALAQTRGQRFDEHGNRVGQEFVIDATNNFGILVTGAETLADGRVLLEIAQVDPTEPAGLRLGWNILDPRNSEIQGTNGDDVITAREGDTQIHALDGNDTLYGRDGDDSFIGGAGNDQLYGFGGADLINGGSGNDRVDGGAGGDTLVGGSGDDTYYVEADDLIVESSGNGLDTVRARSSFALAEGVSVERLETSNSAGTTVIDLTGNSLSNALRGNAAANILKGGGGNDVLVGGKGVDTLYGGTGADKFRYESKVEGGDKIMDFVSGTDDLMFLKAEFGNVSSITGTNYVENTSGAATTAQHRFILETDTGILRFDSNGSAAGGITVIATLNVSDLSAGDFLFV